MEEALNSWDVDGWYAVVRSKRCRNPSLLSYSASFPAATSVLQETFEAMLSREMGLSWKPAPADTIVLGTHPIFAHSQPSVEEQIKSLASLPRNLPLNVKLGHKLALQRTSAQFVTNGAPTGVHVRPEFQYSLSLATAWANRCDIVVGVRDAQLELTDWGEPALETHILTRQG